MDQGLQFFHGFSLVDITPTGRTRGNDPDDVERNQQRNWETVLQCMSLRTQPLHIAKPQIMEIDDLRLFEFGDFYSGNHRVWAWKWAVEREGIYDLPNKKLGAIQADFEQVPVITYLTETARFLSLIHI